MRLIEWILATAVVLAPCTAVDAHSDLMRFSVPVRAGEVVVEGFEKPGSSRPVVLVLSGSRGFGASAYNEIAKIFRAAGLDIYLVHILVPGDVSAIAMAGSSSARMKYYAGRFPAWAEAVRDVASYFNARPNRSGVGLLGISLGAETAALASIDNRELGALVLVDGVPEADTGSVRFLPPLHMIWGTDDRVFSLSSMQSFGRKASDLGESVSLRVFKGGQHNFFLKPQMPQAQAAYASAVTFFKSSLSRHP